MVVRVYDGGLMGSSPNLYYLGHPVLLTGAEVENTVATLTVDTATSVPFVPINFVPSVGDYVNISAVNGRWAADQGGSGGGGVAICMPCNIPTSDLTVSWINLITGDGSATMTHTSGPDAWTTGCADDGLLFKLQCNSGNIELQVTYFVAGSCPTGEANFCSNAFGAANPFLLTLASFTCSPFTLVFSVTEDGCPSVNSAGNTQFTITL